MASKQLPAAYQSEMLAMLGVTEGEQFLNSYEQERLYGLRLNTMKVHPSSPVANWLIQHYQLRPIPWCKEGYYYNENQRPGRHPYHTAGLYYIQEPSAMSAVELLDPQPGETILDLAAAPGGKTTQIAAKMQGEGLLISNEIHPTRSKILAENVERMGIRNTIVTNAAPYELSNRFPGMFDRIMLDAPCSGEGMFRKDENALAEWSLNAVEVCATRQRDILPDAIKMLKPGGILAYSTCTFNRAENEDNMQWLIQQFPEMELMEECRIWPHLEQGEGHYVALLRKHESSVNSSDTSINPSKSKKKKTTSHSRGQDSSNVGRTLCLSWLKKHVPGLKVPEERLVSFGEAWYILPQSLNVPVNVQLLEGLKVPRAGLRIGTIKKDRFEPDHALAMHLTEQQVSQIVHLDQDSSQLIAYLRGEALTCSPDLAGWTLVTVDRYPVGWGKCSGGQLKNHVPKGLRLTGKIG